MKRYAVAWTGGKDCALALRLARMKGMSVETLVTFASADKIFFAHSLSAMEDQARSIGLPHEVVILSSDYEVAYRNALSELNAKGFNGIITGDIDFSEDGSNWMQERCDEADLELVSPLWQLPRETILEKLIAGGFDVVFSAVKEKYFGSDWLGRRLDEQAFKELKEKSRRLSADLCGERGCYHTMTLFSRDFSYPLELPEFKASRHNELWVMSKD